MKKYIFIIIIILVIALVLFLPGVIRHYQIVKAVSGMPYQIGLTKAKIINCSLSCCSPAGCRCCTGGTLCSTITDEANCTTHSDVSGMPSGGMGMMALFSNVAIMQSGLKAGGQLIAGGMTMTMMDNGVLASDYGCYGCMAKDNLSEKILAWFENFDKYVMALVKVK